MMNKRWTKWLCLFVGTLLLASVLSLGRTQSVHAQTCNAGEATITFSDGTVSCQARGLKLYRASQTSPAVAEVCGRAAVVVDVTVEGGSSTGAVELVAGSCQTLETSGQITTTVSVRPI